MKKHSYGRIRADTGQHRRILISALLFGIVLFAPVAARLWQLMVTQHSYYSQLALRNQSRSTQVSARRGDICDRNMDILATSIEVETVYLDPRELEQSGADLEMISQFLGQTLTLEPQWILEQASDLTMRYKQVAARIDTQTADRIRSFINENAINGIHLEPGYKRYYPYGTLASQLIGFTNLSNQGSEGIEASYDAYLAGSPGNVVTTKGNNEMDMPYSYEAYTGDRAGCTVVLTLDTVVQTCLEKRMEEAIAKYDVQNGAFGLVMEVKTGKILAMATLGGFDPNTYLEVADADTAESLEQQRQAYLSLGVGSEQYLNGQKAYQEALQNARLKQWRNRVISDGYEPGSTFKVLTLAAALDCGAVTLDTGFHCSGAEYIPGRSQLLHCWRSTGHGSQQTPQALQNSCNLAFAHIALKLGGDRFYDYVQRFGILEKTGVDLFGESKGVFFDKALVTDTNKWGTASLTSGSFGQTFKLTPLQLVRAICAVVNGGVLMEPYLVEEVIDPDGNTVLRQEPTQIRRVISQETSQTMCQLMRSVVEVGTAKNAAVAGYAIGGKTGTSEKIDVKNADGTPTLDKIVSFVGVATMEDPEYIVLVALDTPSRQTGLYISGGVMAAPTVGAVLQDILPYLEVEPQYGPEDAAGQSITLADYTGMTLKEAQKALGTVTALARGQGETVTDQLPKAGQTVSGASQILLYFGDNADDEKITVPDLSGMTRQQASDALLSLGLNMLVVGNTQVAPTVKVTEQSPASAEQVLPGTAIKLRFTDLSAAD